MAQTDGYLVSRVILPNILSPIVVQASLTMSLAVLIEAALSFLGLGVQEPTPAWGSMLQSSQLYLRQAPWFVFSPGSVFSSPFWPSTSSVMDCEICST